SEISLVEGGRVGARKCCERRGYGRLESQAEGNAVLPGSEREVLQFPRIVSGAGGKHLCALVVIDDPETAAQYRGTSEEFLSKSLLASGIPGKAQVRTQVVEAGLGNMVTHQVERIIVSA